MRPFRYIERKQQFLYRKRKTYRVTSEQRNFPKTESSVIYIYALSTLIGEGWKGLKYNPLWVRCKQQSLVYSVFTRVGGGGWSKIL